MQHWRDCPPVDVAAFDPKYLRFTRERDGEVTEFRTVTDMAPTAGPLWLLVNAFPLSPGVTVYLPAGTVSWLEIHSGRLTENSWSPSFPCTEHPDFSEAEWPRVQRACAYEVRAGGS